MDVGSAGAGSLAQIAPTQSGSAQQVIRAEKQQATLETASTEQNTPAPQPGQRLGSVVDVTI
jgi:hypothetical protein